MAVVGDATVGKSALLQVLKSSGHEYPKNYVMVLKYSDTFVFLYLLSIIIIFS